MDLKKLNDEDLLKRTRTLAENDRKLTVEILWHLAEIENRKLHAERAYSSLYEYCIKELKFSSGTSARRIAAMRLLKRLPSLEHKILSGDMSLAKISLAALFFKEQKKKFNIEYSDEAKATLLSNLEFKTYREAEKILRGISPIGLMKEKARVLGLNRTEITIQIDDELFEKLEFIKANCVHQLNGSVRYADVLRLLADKMIVEIAKKRGREFIYVREQSAFQLQ